MRHAYEINWTPVSPEIGRAAALAAGLRIMEKRNRERLSRRAGKLNDPHERASVQRAMLLVEDALCKAFWVLARLPGEKGNGYSVKHGIDYLPEKHDRDYTIASGGEWDDDQGRPPIPSGKEIDAMDEPMEWLRLLDREHARILATGVRWKHGESCRRISWPRLRQRYTEFGGYSTRTLQRRYHEALRTIAISLPKNTLANLARY